MRRKLPDRAKSFFIEDAVDLLWLLELPQLNNYSSVYQKKKHSMHPAERKARLLARVQKLLDHPELIDKWMDKGDPYTEEDSPEEAGTTGSGG